MRRNALADYQHALAVAHAWAETAVLTGDPRHVCTAEACRAIAAERLRALQHLVRRAPAPGEAREPATEEFL